MRLAGSLAASASDGAAEGRWPRREDRSALPIFLSSSGSGRTNASRWCDSELFAAANAHALRNDRTYQGMADFHFAMDSMADAQKFAVGLEVGELRVVVLRIMKLVEGVVH